VSPRESIERATSDRNRNCQTDGLGRPGLRARVTRVQSAGPVVKIELQSEANQPIYVEMAHDRFRREPHAVGSEVFVTPRDARIFVENYTI